MQTTQTNTITRNDKIKMVAKAHANYITRMAGGNIWGSRIDKMVERIIKQHQENNTPEESLDGLLKKYEDLKKIK